MCFKGVLPGTIGVVLVSIVLFLVPAGSSRAEVVVFDTITVQGRPVMLRALTKGRFFPSGGQIVEFSLDGKEIGRTLSGGDGYAFLEIKPGETGLHEVEAKSKGERSGGYLLVCNKGDKLFFIEIENALMGSLLSDAVRQGADVVLPSIMKSFRVVYVTGLLGASRAREWIRTNRFPPSVIIDSLSEEYIQELTSMGLIPYAVVGSPGLVGPAGNLIRKRFSFVPMEGVTEVKDWYDLRKKLYEKPGRSR